MLTNGCGGLNPAWTPGTPVLIRDHLNLTAASPIEGANFVDLTDLYSPRLRELAREVDPDLDEGVYVQFRGPHYETPAEVQMAKILGGDLVGMSTALEAIAARQMRPGGPRDLAGDEPCGGHRRPAALPRRGARGRPGRSRALRSPARRRRREDRRPAMTGLPGHQGTHPGYAAPRDLLERATSWRDDDPDEATRAELDAVLEAARSGDAEAGADLADRFVGMLEFGTAGLRGALGAGPNRMNRSVVIRAAAGLTAYLQETSPEPLVVIGLDARHNSDVFARRHRSRGRRRRWPCDGAAPPVADSGAGLRDPSPRRGRRRHGDGKPQPCPGQRLQGLSRRRQPDRAAFRCRDRSAHRRGRPRR